MYMDIVQLDVDIAFRLQQLLVHCVWEVVG